MRNTRCWPPSVTAGDGRVLFKSRQFRQTDFEGDGERVWWLSGRCSTRFPQYAHFLTKSSWLAVGCRTEGEFLGVGPTASIIKTSHEDESSHRKDAPDMSTSTTLGSIR